MQLKQNKRPLEEAAPSDDHQSGSPGDRADGPPGEGRELTLMEQLAELEVSEGPSAARQDLSAGSISRLLSQALQSHNPGLISKWVPPSPRFFPGLTPT